MRDNVINMNPEADSSNNLINKIIIQEKRRYRLLDYRSKILVGLNLNN